MFYIYMSSSEAWQSGSQCILSLYSYEVATSPPTLCPCSSSQ